MLSLLDSLGNFGVLCGFGSFGGLGCLFDKDSLGVSGMLMHSGSLPGFGLLWS